MAPPRVVKWARIMNVITLGVGTSTELVYFCFCCQSIKGGCCFEAVIVCSIPSGRLFQKVRHAVCGNLTAREIDWEECNEREGLAWVVDARALRLANFCDVAMVMWLFEARTEHVRSETVSQMVLRLETCCTEIALDVEEFVTLIVLFSDITIKILTKD
jgi:hypothetical protein